MQSNLTSSGALAPWKRGEVPSISWPEAPPMQARIAVDDLREAPPMEDVPAIAVDRDIPGIELDEQSTRSFHEVESELVHDRRLALDAYRDAPNYPDELVLDELADEDELDELEPTEDESVLGDDDIAPPEPTNYVPALLDRTRGTFTRVVSKAVIPAVAIALIVLAMGGTWSTAGATPAPQWSATTPPAAAHAAPTAPRTSIESDEPEHPAKKSNRKDLAGKLNLNTASEDQLMLLPTVGPSKAERIVTWRKKNGGFKRTADLRRVKGFGYKTFKKLEPFLDIKGDTTLAAK